MPLYTPPTREIQCFVTTNGGSTAELGVFPGPTVPIALTSYPNPLFIATGPGWCFGLVVHMNPLVAGNTGTFRIRRSQDLGNTWIDLGTVGVSCTIAPAGTDGSDLVHMGAFVAGDWILATAQFSASDFRNGGLRFKYRYRDNS